MDVVERLKQGLVLYSSVLENPDKHMKLFDAAANEITKLRAEVKERTDFEIALKDENERLRKELEECNRKFKAVRYLQKQRLVGLEYHKGQANRFHSFLVSIQAFVKDVPPDTNRKKLMEIIGSVKLFADAAIDIARESE